ncbi:MAG: carbamoyl phosphate synthase large subunit, partial [Deltaproteobacteria bacterium RIFOXYD12_FULL_55_16]
PEADDFLTTAMKSVGETMAIGRTFKEAFQKGMRSLEIGVSGFGADPKFNLEAMDQQDLENGLRKPNSKRFFQVFEALRRGMSIDKIYEISFIDPWFLHNFKQIVEMEARIRERGFNRLDHDFLQEVKQLGYSDRQLAYLTGTSEEDVWELREKLSVQPVYKLVDTCAAEFEAYTPYYYSTYEQEDEARETTGPKVMILGGGPNRIGQGIEFDYCCVHAAFALKEMGIESIMVNSNPETVSTDYDTSDKLYFEPLTREDVLHIIKKERPDGVIVQFGGQTPLNLAVPLAKAGVPILGTSPDSIDRAEDRKRFQQFLHKLNLLQPENGTAQTADEALVIAAKIGYPVVVRPSYVLGGRAMRIVYNERDLAAYMNSAIDVSPDRPILIDKFLKDAIEIDVDAISDGETTIIGGIMQHIEEAGIHSGDSACVLPPHSISTEMIETIKNATRAMAAELKVKGLMNIQYAVKENVLYILEVNPRASRTIPFVSKATGIPLAKLATKVMLGKTLAELGLTEEIVVTHYAVKEAVFPFDRFDNVDTLLGPEMKSTGEVMGMDACLGLAFAKAQLAAGQKIPTEGNVFLSVRHSDKPALVPIAKKLIALGFNIIATRGTARILAENEVACASVHKVSEGRPHILDKIQDKQIQWIVNTSLGTRTTEDAYTIRRAALNYHLPYTTTIAGAESMVKAIGTMQQESMEPKSVQEYFA